MIEKKNLLRTWLSSLPPATRSRIVWKRGLTASLAACLALSRSQAGREWDWRLVFPASVGGSFSSPPGEEVG